MDITCSTHTLLDCFYAARLLRFGGVLVVDDVSWPSVRRVVDFLKNVPCFEEVGAVRNESRPSWKKVAARIFASPLSRERWKGILAPRWNRIVFED
jgi:hypothetical protein